MPGFIFRRMPDTYRRQSAPGGVQIDKTRPRPEPGKKFKPRKPRGKCTLLRAGGAEQAPRGTGAYCVFPLPRTPSSHLPKTFDLIESLFMVGGKIDIVPCENGFEKNSRSNDASGVFFE